MCKEHLISMATKTPAERHAFGVMGGKASAKARHEKGIAIRAAQYALKLAPSIRNPEVLQDLTDHGFDVSSKLTVLTVAMTRLAAKAMAGDAGSLEALVNFAGEGYSQKQKDAEIEIKRQTLEAQLKESAQGPRDQNLNVKLIVDDVEPESK